MLDVLSSWVAIFASGCILLSLATSGVGMRGRALGGTLEITEPFRLSLESGCNEKTQKVRNFLRGFIKKLDHTLFDYLPRMAARFSVDKLIIETNFLHWSTGVDWLGDAGLWTRVHRIVPIASEQPPGRVGRRCATHRNSVHLPAEPSLASFSHRSVHAFL